MAQVRTPPSPSPATGTSRPLRRRRGLPSGRAVVGGFLVALATVGVFAAYTAANADLIYPGQQLVLPRPPVPPATP